MKFRNYRSFRDFTINLTSGACLVGPNNAGKSTVLTALRLADVLIRLARARKPTGRYQDGGLLRHGYEVPLDEFPSLRESLRHEFRGDEARLEVTWANGNRLVAVWPEDHRLDEDASGFFYLVNGAGQQPLAPSKVRADFPRIGIVPILTPLDHSEQVLNEDYVARNVSTRLSSRHFRNQLLLLRNQGTLEEFSEFAEPWLPGVSIDELVKRDGDPGTQALDLFLSEAGSRIPKEAIWAGDGIQVWLQILFHVYRLRDSDVIVLDEPDVYLHADLQRRLVQLLESVGAQTIVATHSPEIVAEMPRRQVIWIDKSRRSARGIRDEALLEKLSNTIGSQFNLKLARAMRARVVVMVEGKDMQILKRIAATVGAERVEFENGIAIVSMLSYSKWTHVEPFAWILNDFLEGSVRCFVILDRDYRPDEAVAAVVAAFDSIDASVHVWHRKELESYLLIPSALARLSGETEETVEKHLAEIVASMEHEILARMTSEEIQFKKSARAHEVTIMADFTQKFATLWADPNWRLAVAPPKDVLSRLNGRLQASNKRAVSTDLLARSLRREEIPDEMRSMLLEIDAAAIASEGVGGTVGRRPPAGRGH